MKYIYLLLFGFAVLAWNPNDEPDLRNYNLWQHHLKHYKITTLVETVPAGTETIKVYGRKKAKLFSLTAVDKSGNESLHTSSVKIRNWRR